MKNGTIRIIIVLLALSISLETGFAVETKTVDGLPAGFVYVDTMIPSLRIDLRYYGDHNFVGQRVDGYEASRLILTEKAAQALKKVQTELKIYSLDVLVFDGYRPQRAVNHFIRWAQDINDTKTKAEFYPEVQKIHLFRDGYIAKRSGHSRGSTVDLTIIDLTEKGSEGKCLDMGTPFDYFGDESASEFRHLKPQQRANRMLLRTLMEKHGFKHYSEEWWHFSLIDEPYPDTYFDFPIK